MTVPKMSQLRPGVDVKMILTRGDHPMGIKVRLNNGHVGRVQSLSTPFQPSTGPDIYVHPSPTPLSSETSNRENGLSQHRSRGGGSSGRGGRYALQDNYSQDPTPLESRSLADYIRFPSSQVPVSASNIPVEEQALQAQMESEYPKLDSALIAAIVADYTDPAEARDVLSALS
ncbi:MAG: hypothetical protein ASARMPRED_008697 [Alectoria sarmentosa]|nr:MAG: hypothetical protein ASARMPRED_008697 [Alectoria sarmentosa]